MGSCLKYANWIFGSGDRWLVCGAIFWFLGVFFAILGFLTDISNTTFLISSNSWYLLAIVEVLLSIPNYICWFACLCSNNKEVKKAIKKE